MASWIGYARYDLELIGFPHSLQKDAATSLALVFGIRPAEALLYVERAPVRVVACVAEPVICGYVRALLATGATLTVSAREGPSWTLFSAEPHSSTPIPGWLMRALPATAAADDSALPSPGASRSWHGWTWH